MKKRKLIWRIFPFFLLIIVVSLSLEAWYFINHSRQFFLENSEKELTIRARLIQLKLVSAMTEGQDRDLDDLCKQLGKSIQTRVTIILPSGEVVGDSFARIKPMENHKNRPEIQAALQGEKGVSVRHSSTLDDTMMYIALPVITPEKEGVRAVVRTAVSISAIDKNIGDMRNQIFLFLAFTVVAAAAASLYVSGRIIRPLEHLKQGAQAFARGNLSNRLALPDTEELSDLARAMNQMAQNLDDRIQDSLNRRKELEAVHCSMQEGVIAIGNDEQIITINNAAAKIFNFSPDQLKKRNILEVARNFDLQNFIQKALSTHEPVEDDIFIQQDGDHILNIHSSALWDAREQRMGTLIIFHDITRIRRLERMHKDFAANVSHELKTPLTTIKGFIETLQEMMADKSQDAAGFLKIIEKNVNRMIELINDLLALSRLERLEGTGIAFAENHLSTLIADAVDSCRAMADKKQMQIHVACPEDLTAMVDPILMEQAIANLVENAVKYSPQKNRVDITARGTDQWVEIAVADYGNGISKEHLPKIFNRFYRVDKGRSRQEGGTGLGLAIVKHIVQYHNGRITVDAVKGKGSTFHICIPC
ncbi:MAG TPA: ATP-binding protein [Desulfotignum sp.]|nr:ATP-binding protein [Desulfotignum sp.]